MFKSIKYEAIKNCIAENSQFTIFITLLLIIIASLAISLPGSFLSGPVWPDGQRYTFNGILLHDMVRDRAIFDPYNYNVEFYTRYPATNLPYGPPFIATIFAVVFGAFGISFSIARCIIAAFTVFAALVLWRLAYKINKSYWLAVLAVSAFIFNPLTGKYSRDITPELAIAFFSFLTIYLFYFYVEHEKKYYGIYSALSFSLGYLCKPYIIPLGIALVLYIISKKKWHLIFSLETLFAVVLTIALILPPTMLAAKYASNEIRAPLVRAPSGLEWNKIIYYPKIAIKELPVITIFALIGFLNGLIKKNRYVVMCMMWAICWYLFFTFYLQHKEPKYFYTFMPSMIIPFAFGFNIFILNLKKVGFDKAGILFIFLWFTYVAITTPVEYVIGYEDAGKYVAEHPHGKSVLFYGKYDGTFMMGIRRTIPKGGPYVLRGDRQLAIRVSYGDAKEYVLVKSVDDIITILNNYQTGYVVIERNMLRAKRFPEYQILLKAVKDNNLFEEVKRFPLQSNLIKLGEELIIYKFSFDKSTDPAKKLKIPVPTLGKHLEVAF